MQNKDKFMDTDQSKQMKSLFFIFLGEKFPSYARASLSLASEHSGLRPHLIAPDALKKCVPKGLADFTPLEDFYSVQPFREASKHILSAHEFRNGFWLRSFERLFVLEQFGRHSSETSLMHAELDQLLFRVDVLAQKLEEASEHGIFIPFHNEDTALGSLLYVKDIPSLRTLVDSFLWDRTFFNEMELLAWWAKKNPQRSTALATPASLFRTAAVESIKPVQTLSHLKAGGVVDAAQLGQWVGGIDPRNIPLTERPYSHFVDAEHPMLLSKKELLSLRLSFDVNSGFLTLEPQNSKPVNLYNLHLHSKEHKFLARNPKRLLQLIESSNLSQPNPLPGARRRQIWIHLSDAVQHARLNPDKAIAAASAIFRKNLSMRQASHPYISGDTFRSMAGKTWEKGDKEFRVRIFGARNVVFVESNVAATIPDSDWLRLEPRSILILGNSDLNQGRELESYLKFPTVTKLYAQNLSSPISGVMPLPIGLENRWRGQHGVPRAMTKSRQQLGSSPKLSRIMWAFSVQTNPTERLAAAKDLLRLAPADKFDGLSPEQHRNALVRYQFVASPPGNGIDTHRTWEAMYLNCVPILLKSYLAQFYEDIGLPVWVVNSYIELQGQDESKLLAKYQELFPKFKTPALWSSYWRDEISGERVSPEIKNRHGA
jgi:hypothetical protein